VDLPFDLSPTIGGVADPAHHAVFLSPHGDPADIGTAFSDELAKLGFTIEPAGLDEALAIRDRQVISLRITPEAGLVSAGGRPRFPTATSTDVALEVWTGQGPPPPLVD
ncbi:MAG: hypothetical protein ACR2QK_05540, partial [Acidimicrobiales bacterium]